MAASPQGHPLAGDALRTAGALVAGWSELPPELAERLSVSQLRVLQHIEGVGVTTSGRLARDLDALPSSVTRLCDRLVAAGQVERSRDEDDRRVQRLRLTDQGRALLRRLDEHRVQVLSQAFDRMRPDDLEALVRGLAAYAEAVHGRPGDPDQAADPDRG